MDVDVDVDVENGGPSSDCGKQTACVTADRLILDQWNSRSNHTRNDHRGISSVFEFEFERL